MVAERQLLYGKRVFGLSFFFSNHDFNPAETNDTKPPLQSFEPNHSHPLKREKMQLSLRKVEERRFSEPEKRSFFVIFAGDCEDDWDEKRITGNYEKKTDI